MTPSWVEIVVPESQRELYEQATDHDIVTVSDDTITLGTTRNAVLRMFDERTIVMMDDDLRMLYCLTGEKTRRIEDPEEIMAVIVNTAIMAMDAGVHFFGFFQKDIRQYKGYEPFSLTGWVGGVVGVIDRRFWFAEGHNRDADLLSNYVHDRKWGLTDEEIEAYFDEVRRTKAEIPEYVYDVHTIKGKRRGKTKADFFSDEEMALAMKQPSLFDIDFAAEG